MVKIFLRVFLVTLGIILSIFFSIHFFASISLGPPPFQEHEIHQRLIALLEASLENASSQEVASLAETVLKPHGVHYTIHSRDDASLPPAMGERFYPKSKLVGLPNDFDTVFYLPFDQGRQVLEVGPVYTKGGPPHDRLAFVFSIVVVLVGLAALLVSMPAWRNLRRFEKATLRLAEGDMSARARNIFGPAGELAHRFNSMADALQHTFESQKHLLQAVSHELRTPVARIHFELEMLELAAEPNQRKQRSDNIVGHLTELNDLLDELLVFVRLDADGPTDTPQPFSVTQALKKLESDYAPTARVPLTLNINITDDLHLLAQQRMFSRALGNLLQNALRYAKSQVQLNCSQDAGFLEISVVDDGVGIPEEHREQIFEPFSRIDSSRNKKSGGVGLGLAIVRRILNRHKGSVTLDTQHQGGTRFVTRWPIKP